MNDEDVKLFWEKNPCGSQFVNSNNWKDFFVDYDNYKYNLESHILDEIKNIDFAGKKVLEIGVGQGAEAQKIIEAGALYYGIDLTEESINRVKLRCRLFDLKYQEIKTMNAEKLEYEDNTFDIVFSHGVIHHSPQIKNIVDEIYRVLKPNGMVVTMVYHKNSVNYQFSIKILRRIGIFLLYLPGFTKITSLLTKEPTDRLMKHKSNLKKEGIGYLKINNFIHKSTDGPDNPFSSVFNKKDLTVLFNKFNNLKFNIHFFNDRHFPVVRSFLTKKMKGKIASNYGWHIWTKGMKPVNAENINIKMNEIKSKELSEQTV